MQCLHCRVHIRASCISEDAATLELCRANAPPQKKRRKRVCRQALRTGLCYGPYFPSGFLQFTAAIVSIDWARRKLIEMECARSAAVDGSGFGCPDSSLSRGYREAQPNNLPALNVLCPFFFSPNDVCKVEVAILKPLLWYFDTESDVKESKSRLGTMTHALAQTTWVRCRCAAWNEYCNKALCIKGARRGGTLARSKCINTRTGYKCRC